MNGAGIERDGTVFRLSGELNMRTVPALWQQAASQLPQAEAAIVVDLGAVDRCDSAALALLVEWMRAARGRGFEIGFRNLPPQLLDIAGLTGLRDMLPVVPS